MTILAAALGAVAVQPHVLYASVVPAMFVSPGPWVDVGIVGAVVCVISLLTIRDWLKNMPNEPSAYDRLFNGGWPWASTLCFLHGLLIFVLVYGPFVAPQALPHLWSHLNFEAISWLHWVWLGWPITGAWRGTRFAVCARIPFGIGLVAWIASCFVVLLGILFSGTVKM